MCHPATDKAPHVFATGRIGPLQRIFDEVGEGFALVCARNM